MLGAVVCMVREREGGESDQPDRCRSRDEVLARIVNNRGAVTAIHVMYCSDIHLPEDSEDRGVAAYQCLMYLHVRVIGTGS